jgi:MipA family protein
MKLNLSQMHVSRVVAITILPFLLLHGATQAQQPGEGDGPPDGGPGGDRIAIGIGGAYMPAYHGSDKYRFQPLPAIDIKYGRFFVNFQDGIGANLIESEKITIGGGFTMTDNYRAKDVPVGIGKLSTGLGGRGFVKLQQSGFEMTLGGTKVITGGTGGFLVDASLSYPIMVNDRLFIAPSIGTTWGDRKNNNRYFGVSAQQSLASGLRAFNAKSGFIDAKLDLHAQYKLTDHFGLGLSAGVSTLLGEVKNSPLVKKKTSPFGIAFISYEF